MPLKYWDKAFFTVVYLISRLPSKVIQSQTPLECLFGDSRDYSLLRIFGCACWPNLPPYNKHKLNSDPKNVLLLGIVVFIRDIGVLIFPWDVFIYLMILSLMRLFFPFASLYSNVGARLFQEIELLPLSLQTLNLHHNEGHELQGRVDVNPANAVDSAAESFLQDYDDDDDSGAISGSGVEINADSSRDRFSAAPTAQDRVSVPVTAPVFSGSHRPAHATRDRDLHHHVAAPESPILGSGSRAVNLAASADGLSATQASLTGSSARSPGASLATPTTT
jgi:hypothetical protein